MIALALLFAFSADAALATMNEAELSARLTEIHGHGLTFQERLREVARLGLGTPYDDGPLGEGPGGTYDDDPLIDLKRVDCVTYVEQTIALSRTAELRHKPSNTLQDIRYREGTIDYETRNQFMNRDWTENNPGARTFPESSEWKPAPSAHHKKA